jgi:hypothetical protein
MEPRIICYNKSFPDERVKSSKYVIGLRVRSGIVQFRMDKVERDVNIRVICTEKLSLDRKNEQR